MVMIACGAWPKYDCRSRPMKRLKTWSVPPSSMSASTATESYPWANG